MSSLRSPTATATDYARRLAGVLEAQDWSSIEALANDLRECWRTGRRVFVCGNGGSGANAVHLANDFLYPVSKTKGSGLRITALTANAAVVTCLANDEGYDEVFAMQLAVEASAGDVLLALSGSGNSPNILRAIEQAKQLGVKSYAIVGFDGGKAKALADVGIHVGGHDMQIAEDMQTIIGHALMQWLYGNPPNRTA